MRTRSLLGAVLAATALTLSACGDAGTITRTGAPARNEGTGSSGDTGTPGTIGSEDTGTDSTDPTTDGSGSDGTSDSLPDLGGVMQDECLQASTAMASMATAMTGAALTPEQQDQIEAARDSLPDDVRDDYDTVAAAFEKVQTDGLIAAGQAMSSPEFEAAQKRIEAYLNKVCGGN